MSMSNSDYPGLPVFANQVGFGLKDKAEQLWGDTHLASGTSFDDYLQDKFKSGIYSGTEGVWNGLVDHGEFYEKGWLLAQNAEMQGQALLNDAYREQAERNNMQTKEVLDELPEYSEGLRSHKAAEYAQQIDELYDAGGLCRIAGDFISSLGKRIPSILVGIFTGDVGKMGYQYFLIEGNAAAEARAGGADEETALLYGVVSGSVRMAMTKIGDVVTKIGDVVKLNDEKLNDWLMGMVQSKTGRTALRHLVGALGNGAKSFINKIAEEYFARMWNDDERGFWQTAGETLPDVIYQELIGILVNSILKVSPDTMPNTSE